MARLSVRLLGPFQVTLDGEPMVGFRSDKVRALLAYLSVEREVPHRREKLAGLLWPDWPESSARTNLRQALANLRQVIGDQAAEPPFLRISRQTIQFNATSVARVDVTEFATLTAPWPPGGPSSLQTIEELEEAVALYRGEFLEGFSLPDSPPFEEWTLLQREQSQRLVIEALDRLIDAYAERGDLEPALQRTWHLLELDPWREQAHRQAMRLLALTGQRSAALAQYETCRRLLAQELDVEPAAQTAELYEEIRSGALEVTAPHRPLTRAPDTARPRHNLPAQLTSFVGRERETAEVMQLLETTRLLTLSGPPGTGKTRLGLRVAAEVLDRFEDGVFFVNLAPITDPGLVATTIAQVLGIGESGGQPLLDTLKNHLRHKHLLLLLDNFEQIADAASLVGELLSFSPGVKALVTSREVLHVYGEQEYPVPPLTLPDLDRMGPLHSLSKYEAVELFTRRACAVRPDFTLTEGNAAAVAEICVRLDGLPLAIELAAARSTVMSPDMMRRRLESCLGMLVAGPADLPARHRTLRGTIDWSYNLLDPSEKTLLARLACFQGGRTVEAVEAVCSHGLSIGVLVGLESLLNKSLLMRIDGSAGEPRFVMLEMIHEYARERLEASGDTEDLQRRHAEYFLGLAERAAPGLRGSRYVHWSGLLRDEHNNMRTALTWALGGGDPELGLRLAGALRDFWFFEGHTAQGLAWTERALERVKDGPPALRARALNTAGLMCFDQGEHQKGKRYNREALALFRELGDDIGTAWALGFLGVQALGSRDECKEGIALLGEALSLFRELDFKPGITQVLIGLGEVAHLDGDRERASRAYAECRAIARNEGDKMAEAKALGNLSYVAQEVGESARAVQLLTRALTLFHELGARRYICQDFARLAGPVAAQGFPQAAARLLGASEALLGMMGLGLQPGDRRDIRRYADAVREQLDRAAFDAAWAKGRAMSFEQAFSYALEVGQLGSAAARDVDTTLVEWLDALGATGTDSLDQPAPCEEIRFGAPAASAPPRPTVPVPPPQLPAALIPFVGRETELEQLRELLADPTCRLLTLVGPGGSGKTRLAVEAASALKDHFAHGVHFVPMAPVESVDAIVPTVAQRLGFPFYPAEGGVQVEPQQQLIDYLRSKNMLLLIDNFEHLLEGIGVITDILRSAPDVRVLATSRARLNVRGEHLFPVRGMHYPAPAAHALLEGAELDDVAHYSAITLFLQGARQARPDFEATEDDLRQIARVCYLLQGMPLGILLAAAWIELLAPGDIAAEIEGGLDFLETGWRAVPERQRSLRAVFDHSWSLLTDREREAFQVLSVFRGGFTRQAAEAVGASLRDLKGLIGKSFLLQAAPAGRYEVHELLRQYAAEKLAALPAAEAAARDRHSTYWTGALEGLAADLKGPRQRAAIAEIEKDSENIRVAWNWAVRQEQIDRLDRAMEGLARFYWRRGRYQEGEAAFRAAVDGLRAGVSPPSMAPDGGGPSGCRLRVLARAVAWHAYFSRALGRWPLDRRERVAWLQEQSLALLERPELAGQDTRAERALITYHIGHTIFMSDYEQAKQLFEQSLALYRALDDPWGVATVLHWLSNAAEFRGAYADAIAALEESLEISRALGDLEGMAWVMSDLAWLAIDQGRFEEAERLAREGVARSQALGDPEGIGFGLLTLGMVLGNVGKFAEARSVLEECWLTFEELGYRSFVTSVQAVQGSIKLHLGRYGEARAHAEKSLSLARERDLQFRVGHALVMLGSVALADQAYGKAKELLREGLAVYRRIKIPADVGWANATLAYAARGLGEPAEMRHHLQQALQAVSDTGAVPTLLWALPAVALLLADRANVERAVELYALASRYGLVAQSRWFQDVAGRHIAALAASLPRDAVAAAKERGRARDLEATAAELLAELEETGATPDVQ